MGYRVERRGGSKPWKVIDARGQIVAASPSRSKALANVRARVSAEGGQTLTYGQGGRAARSLRRRTRPRRPAVTAARG